MKIQRVEHQSTEMIKTDRLKLQLARKIRRVQRRIKRDIKLTCTSSKVKPTRIFVVRDGIVSAVLQTQQQSNNSKAAAATAAATSSC